MDGDENQHEQQERDRAAAAEQARKEREQQQADDNDADGRAAFDQQERDRAAREEQARVEREQQAAAAKEVDDINRQDEAVGYGSSATGPGPLSAVSPEQQQAGSLTPVHMEKIEGHDAIAERLNEVAPRLGINVSVSPIEKLDIILDHPEQLARGSQQLSENSQVTAPADDDAGSEREEIPVDARNAIQRAAAGVKDLAELLDAGLPTHHSRLRQMLDDVGAHITRAQRAVA